MLLEQLRLRQQHLQKQLRTRLSISAELKKQRSNGQKFTEATYKQLLSSVVFVNADYRENLIKEFDSAFAGLLCHLSSLYKLSDLDQLFIVMIALGCTTNEISELANVTTHSVGNRKQRLRQLVGADCNIDEWLQREVDACLTRLIEK